MTAAENCGINFVADYCSALSATATNKRPSCDGITSAPLSAARGDVFCRCWQHESFYKCRHVCEQGILCDCTPYMLMHIYDFVFASLCAYIKRPLTAIGGSGGAAGVFALAAIQHSTFLCDIQYCDLRKPALQRSLLSLSHSPSLCSLSLPLATSPILSVFVLSALSLSITPPSFHIWAWEIMRHPHPPPKPSFYFPSLILKNVLHNVTLRLTEVPWRGTFLSTPSLNTHLVAIMKKSQHCPGHLMYHSDAYFSFIRNSLCIHSTAVWTGVTPSISLPFFPSLISKP